jgi:hypothetical protein
MRIRFPLPLATAALVLLASGCTWVKMAPGASSVKVVTADPAGCEKRGEIAVSVASKVALYRRNPLRVREELETLARNEAAGIGADTVNPLGDPVDGDQRYTAWRCGR